MLLSLHPTDIVSMEKSMLKAVGTGVGRLSKLFLGGDGAGAVRLSGDKPGPQDCQQGWWPHPHTQWSP